MTRFSMLRTEIEIIQRDAMTEARIDVFRGVAKDSEVEAELCPTMVARTVACLELDTLGLGTYHHCHHCLFLSTVQLIQGSDLPHLYALVT